MATEKDTLTLRYDADEVSLSSLVKTATLWLDLVSRVSDEVTSPQARRAVRWVVVGITYASPLQIAIAPRPKKPDLDPRVITKMSEAVRNGIGQLQDRPLRPDYFTDAAVQTAKELAKLSSERGVRRIEVSNGHGSAVAVTSQLVANVDKLVGPVVESYGTIEGRLEGLVVHGERRFFIYDSLANRQVTCHFGERISLTEIFQAFEKRVAATGLIRSKLGTGERVSVEVAQLEVFPSDDLLPPVTEILRLLGGQQ